MVSEAGASVGSVPSVLSVVADSDGADGSSPVASPLVGLVSSPQPGQGEQEHGDEEAELRRGVVGP